MACAVCAVFRRREAEPSSTERLFALLVVATASVVSVTVVGFIVGATYGGNYAVTFELAGVRGYEATGLLGAMAGALVTATAWGIVAWRSRARIAGKTVVSVRRTAWLTTASR